jgi:hypothetical protein
MSAAIVTRSESSFTVQVEIPYASSSLHYSEVIPVFGDDGPNGRHVPDLMTQRLRVVAMQRLLAMAAGRRFSVVDGVGMIDEGTLDLGVSVLTAGFFGRGRLGRCSLDGRWVRRGRLGGVGRILIEPCFELGEALLVVLNQSPDSGLSSGRDLLPEFVRDWRVRIHAAGLAIKLRLGNLDP